MIHSAVSWLLASAALGGILCAAEKRALPPRKTQPTPREVVEEHLAAFNACDWPRVMAQFPDDVELFFPNGVVVRGREAAGKMFAEAFSKPAQGGTCGLRVTPEHIFAVGETVNVQWRAEAPFLAKPYRGADAYETHNGLMAAQVSTFDKAGFQLKNSK